MKRYLLIPAIASFFIACESNTKNEPITVNYPETRQGETVDTYFGTEVKDPYRWLEDDLSAETEAWVKEQNSVTFGYLDNIPFRTLIHLKN